MSYADIHRVLDGRWTDVLAELGIDADAVTGRNGPCPGCGGTDRFRWDRNKEAWYCSQGGAGTTGGDAIALLSHCGWSGPETYARLRGFLPEAAARRRATQNNKAEVEKIPPQDSGKARDKAAALVGTNSRYVSELPAPDREYRSLRHRGLGEPAHYWEYQSAQGELMYAVARFEGEYGKQLRPLSHDGKQWRWKRPHVLIPMNLPNLYARRSAPVLVTEGEKACEAASALAKSYVATCGHGGASQAHLTHWDHLWHRDVTILPDDDRASVEQWAPQLAAILKPMARTVRVIDPARFWRGA